MLHSGSRGIGNKIGNYFINLAKQDMAYISRIYRIAIWHICRRGPGISTTTWKASNGHRNTRIAIANYDGFVAQRLKYELPEFTIQAKAINCHHNYIARERHYGKDVYVTRKGAIRAGKGELGIIPGSMGAASYIVRGKGNAESFNSCAHGAGRQYSRSQARRMFTKEDLREQTYGVECRKDGGVLDEIPGRVQGY